MPCRSTNPSSNAAKAEDALTSTVNRWRAESPPGSVAVTVMVAVPSATPTAVTLLPDADALLTPPSEVVAA